jgi:hypothetical protein
MRRRLGRSQPGIDANRRKRSPAGKSAYVFAGRPRGDELPSRPSELVPTSRDALLPVFRGSVGGSVSGSISASYSWKDASATRKKARKRTPLMTSQNSAAAAATPVRRVDRLESHRPTDRILPLCRLPERDECNDRATGCGGEPGDAQEASIELHEFHIGPKPGAEHADVVTGRQRTSRKPCVKKVRRNSVGVREATKKSVPRKRPPAENERHDPVFMAGDRMVTILHVSTFPDRALHAVTGTGDRNDAQIVGCPGIT